MTQRSVCTHAAGAQVLSLPDMGGRFYEVYLVDVCNEIPFISEPASRCRICCKAFIQQDSTR